MQILESFQFKNLKYNLINKFFYKDLKLPKVEKVVLTFKGSSSSLKKLAIFLLALEFINPKPKSFSIIVAKKPNLNLKIKKGNPIGCKVILSKKLVLLFLNKIIFQMVSLKKKSVKLNANVYSFVIKSQKFRIIRTFYSLFNVLEDKLNLNLIFSNSCTNEILFLLKKKKLI